MTKKILPIVTLALLGIQPLRAQTNSVRPVEFEMRIGATTPLSGFHGGNKEPGAALGVELRYNLKDSPIDLGVNIDITTAMYNFDMREYYDYTQSNRSALFGIVVDYNLCQGGKVNPFFGMAFGICKHDALNEVAYDDHDGDESKFVSPRIGVELRRHFRATLAANLSCRGYSNLSLTMGYVIVGGKKHKQ